MVPEALEVGGEGAGAGVARGGDEGVPAEVVHEGYEFGVGGGGFLEVGEAGWDGGVFGVGGGAEGEFHALGEAGEVVDGGFADGWVAC